MKTFIIIFACIAYWLIISIFASFFYDNKDYFVDGSKSIKIAMSILWPITLIIIIIGYPIWVLIHINDK